MLVETKKSIAVFLAAAAMLVASGCAESDGYSHFVVSDDVSSLMTDARKRTVSLVDERFGTPQELRAWVKLPVDFGGVKGSVAGIDGESVLELTLEDTLSVEDDNTVILQFITGEAAGQTVEAEATTEDGVKVTLSGELSPAPAAGDLVVVNGGENLKHGRGLYMRHCSHCHGTSGDGAGPTAEYLNPLPRDYRHGIFKFTSTTEQAKVSRDDLKRILRNGIPGTYMPSFVPMLDNEELDTVVEYVRFLAMRGEYERKVAAELKGDYSLDVYRSRVKGGESKSDIVEELREFLEMDLADGLEFAEEDLIDRWSEADTEDVLVTPPVPRVEDSLESRQRGRELFLSAALKCTNCHGVSGQGNGPQTRDYEIADGTRRPLPGLYNEWGHVVHPRNLTTGIYRGGRRPLDIYRRIHAGIKGAKMPAFGGTTAPEDIWHLVNYVLSIPFEVEPGRGPAAEDDSASTASL